MRKLFCVCLALIAAWWLWSRCAAISRPSGVLVSEEPVQLAVDRAPIKHGEWQLKPLARYAIKARVLSKQSYAGDPPSDLAPYDLAVGWGKMSDTAVLDELSISQGFRCYRWHCWGELPIPKSEISRYSSNMHLIPADASVLAVIRGLRTGSLVKLSGFLVEATHEGHTYHPWTSSLTRADTGDGACELMLVNSAMELD